MRQKRATVRLLLLNPNTNATTTKEMVAIAQTGAPGGVEVEGATADDGVPLIVDEPALAEAATGVLRTVRQLPAAYDGVIVAAFGDPGVEHARLLCACPVTGIAEASIAEAARYGRRFAIVTTTPLLVASIEARVHSLGFGATFCGVYLTVGETSAVMADPLLLEQALLAGCVRAIGNGAEAIVIGGGPLAVAARAISARCPVPLVEPIPAAVHLAHARACELSLPGCSAL